MLFLFRLQPHDPRKRKKKNAQVGPTLLQRQSAKFPSLPAPGFTYHTTSLATLQRHPPSIFFHLTELECTSLEKLNDQTGWEPGDTQHSKLSGTYGLSDVNAKANNYADLHVPHIEPTSYAVCWCIASPISYLHSAAIAEG